MSPSSSGRRGVRQNQDAWQNSREAGGYRPRRPL